MPSITIKYETRTIEHSWRGLEQVLDEREILDVVMVAPDQECAED